MDALTREQQIEYLSRLNRLTGTGRVHWESDKYDSNYGFHALLPTTSVWIASRDNDDFHPYKFTIDRLAEELYSEKNEMVVIESNAEDPQLNDALAELYSTVKRQVLKLDELPAQIFKDLDELEAP